MQITCLLNVDSDARSRVPHKQQVTHFRGKLMGEMIHSSQCDCVHMIVFTLDVFTVYILIISQTTVLGL